MFTNLCVLLKHCLIWLTIINLNQFVHHQHHLIKISILIKIINHLKIDEEIIENNPVKLKLIKKKTHSKSFNLKKFLSLFE